MQLELNFRSQMEGHPVAGLASVIEDKLPVNEVAYLSPTGIKQLLLKVMTQEQQDFRSTIWNRQLDGALNRVPQDFYDRVWQILDRTPAGLKVAGYHLPQVIKSYLRLRQVRIH